MAGAFSKTVRPKLAGAYFNWEAESGEAIQPNIAGIVAIPVTHDWGPDRTPVLAESWDDWKAIYGDSDTAGARAVRQAFKGQGQAGRGGAGAVLSYRMGAAAIANATRALQNTTPATALTLTARYRGSRGNALRVTVQAGSVAGTKELVILEGTRVLERYVHPQTNLASLAADVNLLSDWVTATVNIDGVALADIASQALAGGNDGTTLTVTEWSAAMTAFESERFSIFVPFDLTDATIRTAIDVWQVTLNDRGMRMLTVLGAASADTIATGVTVATGLNDWNAVYLAGFQAKVLDVVGEPTFSPSQFAPRVAGAIAFLGESKDLIYTRFADVELIVGASVSGEEAALDGGVTTMRSDTHATAPAYIREGVTTYVDDSTSPVVNGQKTRPKALYKRIKNVRIQHGVELEVTEWFESGSVAGELPVNDRTRAIAKGFIQALLQGRVDAEVVQGGFTVEIDTDPPPSDDQDFIQLLWGFHPTRSWRQMFNTVRLG